TCGSTTARKTTSCPTTKASSPPWRAAMATSPSTPGPVATKAATGAGTGPTTSAGMSPAWRTVAKAVAVAVFAIVLGAIVYLVLAATVFGPVDEHGARVEHLTIESQAVGRELGVNVVVPAKLPEPRGKRPLLVFLHGRGGSDGTFTGNEAVYEGLAKLGGKAPIVAFPDGG